MEEKINKVVETIINIYMEEDYDYMVSLAKKGQRVEGLSSIDEGIDFIKRNNLGDGLSDEDIRKVAEIVFPRIKAIEGEAFSKYNRKTSLAEAIKNGEQVEMFDEDVGPVLEEMFKEHSTVHVDVFISESVTWIKRV